MEAATTLTQGATGSYDPNGSSLHFVWTLGSAPSGVSGGVLTTSPTYELELSRAGTYALTLEVQNDAGQRDDAVLFLEAIPPELSVDAGEDEAGVVGTPTALVGTIDAADPTPPSLMWELITRPPGSGATIESPTTLASQFVPDLMGRYEARLTVDVAGQIATDTVVVFAQTPHVDLTYHAVDFEYSDVLDRAVVVSQTPPQVHLVDARTGDEQVVALPTSPIAVSLEPGGTRAAVGADGTVAVVDLQTMTVTSVFFVSAVVGDLFFGDDGRIHCMPATGQWTNIRTIDSITGVETLGFGTIRHGTKARINPGNPSIAYGANNGLSPSDIERYDAQSDPITFIRDSPYHGDYAMCGNLWFSDDGSRIITRCGNTFRSSDDPALDMTYQGRMGNGNLLWVDHAPTNGSLAAIEYDFLAETSTIATYSDDFLSPLSSEPMPQFLEFNQPAEATGRWLAHSADESDLFVVAEGPSSTLIFRMSP